MNLTKEACVGKEEPSTLVPTPKNDSSSPCTNMEGDSNSREPEHSVQSHSQSPSRKLVHLTGGPNWGFRTCGGRDTNIPLRIARVNPGSKAARSGIREGDLVTAINGMPIDHMTNGEVQRILKKTGASMTLELKSAKRMSTFEGSASTAGESESSAGASSSVVPKKPSSTDTGPSSSSHQTSTSNGSLSSPTTTLSSPDKTSSSDTTKELNGGSGKKKKSPSHTSQGKSGKNSTKKKSVEFQERSVDGERNIREEPLEEKPEEEQRKGQESPKEEGAEEGKSVDRKRGCTCGGSDGGGGGGGYSNYRQFGTGLSRNHGGTNNGTNTRNGSLRPPLEADNRGSLLGEIMAELDGFLDTTYFSYQSLASAAPLSSHNYGSGVWAPGSSSSNTTTCNSSPLAKRGVQQQSEGTGLAGVERRGSGDQVDSSGPSSLPALEEPPPVVWTPPNAPSPATQKKFRPVNFNVPSSPTSSSPRTISLERSFSAGHVGDQKLQIGARSPADSRSFPDQQQQEQLQYEGRQQSSVQGGSQDLKTQSSDQVVLQQSQSSPSVNLPRYQSPTVTLLQKAREGHLPKGALYLDHKNGGVQRSSSASGGFNSLLSQQQHPAAGPSSSSQPPYHQQQQSLNPNDTLYELKKEDYNTTLTGATRRAEFTPKKYDGVGPTTPEGVPISLKTGINSNGHEWYRRMYESLHVDNKPHRKGPPQRSAYGGPTGGSWSEPEGYESDTYAYKYATLDRRKVRDRYVLDTEYLSPGASTPTSIPGSIRFTPGRIEDYTPGNSSVVAKEIRRHKPTLQWALGSKDFGYESDSNLVIRKRQESQEIPPPPPLSPAEQHQLYVEIQKGGEVPFHGLRKPAPEKPKVMSPMPTFEDVKRSLASPRPGSPSSFRSGSPSMLKSTTTVALLQERIQAKLRRANSDINPSRIPSRSRSSTAATRFIHTVRSMSQARSIGPTSFIPIRSRNPSMEKLRVSSPELTSPREVKKAMETSHKLSIKVEVFETVPAPSGGKKSRQSESDKRSSPKKSTSKSSKGKGKSVKIAEMAAAAAAGSSNNGASTPALVPVKPPRKVNGKAEKPDITLNGAKVKTLKASPVATRHASCLSPHHSRPTSPGGGVISTPSTSTTPPVSIIPVPPKIPPPQHVKVLPVRSTGKADRKKASTSPPSGSTKERGDKQQDRNGRSAGEIQDNENKESGKSARISRASSGVSKVTSSTTPTAATATTTPLTVTTTTTTTTTSADSGIRSKAPKVEVESRRGSKRSREEIESKSLLEKKGSTTAAVPSSPSAAIPLALSLHAPPSSTYLTLPVRREYLTDVWTLDEEHRGYRSRSSTPNFRSLPALTPYLKETKRVSGSTFVTKTNHAAMLREKAALAKRIGLQEGGSSSGGLKPKGKVKVKSRSTSGTRQGALVPATTTPAESKPRQPHVIRSVSCLGLRRSWDYTYAKYILELQHSRKKSPRFLQLHRLYSSLERLGQLERSTSMYDIPILSLERQLDFDAWWKVRNRNRVDEEIASISSELTQAQKNREFFFRPRRVEEFRWKGDSALRCKQWSISELRSFLMGELFDGRDEHSKSAGDLHKTAWRGASVKEVALTMEVNALSKAGYTFNENNRLFGGPWLRRAFSMSSTLSEDQRENIKRRLGSLIRPECLEEKKEREGRPVARRVVTSRMGHTTSSDRPGPSGHISSGGGGGRVVGTDGYLTEAAKKHLSRSLSQEFRERKIMEKKQKKTSESESAKSDDSVRTVIHVPISTQLLLKKMERDKERSKVPAYSVYCSKGVPSKVTFFESYYGKGEPGRQFSTLPAPTSKGKGSGKVILSGSSTVGRSVTSPRRGMLQPDLHYHHRLHHERQSSVSPARSPTSGLKSRRSRSASPASSTKTGLSYMSHVNVISHLASMLLKKDEALKSLVTREILEREKLERLRLLNAGEVDRLKYYFETRVADDMDDVDDEYRKILPEISLLRCLFCSDPNLAQMTEWRSEHCDRRCASADIFKEKLLLANEQEYEKEEKIRKSQQQQLDRKPDGRESSPVNCSSPDLYLNSRSRKPIYQPSSTPNVCQPTLTAHCFLESPNKSLEYLNQTVQQPASSSCYSSDFSGNFWDYYSTDSVGTASPSPPYHSISIPPAPRMLDSRVSNNTSASSTSNRNWNVDPALHQPKFRYVPPQPRTNVHAIPPPIPPPPPSSALLRAPHYHLQHQKQHQEQGTAQENRPYNPYLYRSVRYWSPRTRTREHDGPIPPNRYPPQASRIQSPPPLPPTSTTTTSTPSSTAQSASKNAVKKVLSFRPNASDDNDEYDDVEGGMMRQSESQLVESQCRRDEALLEKNSVSHNEPHSPAPAADASPLLPSPVKYSESEVNIHYKAPVRLVEKDYIAEEELRIRQQQSMRRFYEEQRQRKFLAEIQDMENRRHTDNFTPSQKSPIPLNRYEDVIDEPERPKWREKTPDQRVVARALYNFVPQNSRELSFRKGDILYIRRKLDANWFEGEHNAAVGIFPSSYVEIIPSYELDRATHRVPSEGQARVRFNFTAASPIEMSIVKGEMVTLTRRVDVNWYEGRIGSRRGIFPVSYVQVLKEPGVDLTSSLSPKPVGSPAAHSLAAHQTQNFRHNYKPNDYVINSDFPLLHGNSSPAPHTSSFSSREIYGAGRLTKSGTQTQGRSSYSQNLTIDTRIEPLSYKAIYNYRPAHEDELELRENDIVHVLEKCDDGWFVGTSTRTGLFGTFPGNYVERVF